MVCRVLIEATIVIQLAVALQGEPFCTATVLSGMQALVSAQLGTCPACTATLCSVDTVATADATNCGAFPAVKQQSMSALNCFCQSGMLLAVISMHEISLLAVLSSRLTCMLYTHLSCVTDACQAPYCHDTIWQASPLPACMYGWGSVQ